MKGRLLSISLVLIFLFLGSTAASAVQYTKIGTGSEPAIDGSKVVWTDGGVIHIYDLTTKKDTAISSASASSPAISGNKLVWHDNSTGVPKLTVYDIMNNSRSQITQDIDAKSAPAINGNIVVWSANGNVYMRDISKSAQTMIAAGNNPDIYGNKITYDSDSAGDTPQIYVYDITTRKAIDASQYGDNTFSHIYGNNVIWSDFYTRLGNIRIYDIATMQQKEVTTGGSYGNGTEYGYDTGGASDIYDKKIVYLKHNDLAYDGLGDVYVYDISTGKSTQLSSGNSAQAPVVSGNIVVWSNSGNIYMTDLEASQ
jgi:beta propeller repeat protein